MDLLEELADAELPVRVTRPSDIDKLRILEAAGHIRSDLRGHWGEPDLREGPATVFQITPLGYKALRYFASPSWQRSINQSASSGAPLGF
jgi:hypothetical protein